MGLRIALAGDTMLGRGVADALAGGDPRALVAPEVVEAAREADLFVLNLECCISERGAPWPDPRKPFFFRVPPRAVETLSHLGVSCVTLANNHALDYGPTALLDTVAHLEREGIAHVGAGADVAAARAPAILKAAGTRLGVVGLTDHPSDFAARDDAAGVAFADLRRGLPGWVEAAVRRAAGEADVVLVTPHWGPNMVPDPIPHVRTAAPALLRAGAAAVAGHSAHVFQGVEGPVLYDLGDFLDDYAVDPALRNDLGLLWFVDLEGSRVRRVEALPLRLEFCFTRGAEGQERAWVAQRFREACAAFGTEVADRGGRLVVEP